MPAADVAIGGRGRGRPRLAPVGVPVTRDRLVAAAAAVCVERGYDGATVGEIARRAGVTTGAIYNHFGGRTELLVEAGRQTPSPSSAASRSPDVAVSPVPGAAVRRHRRLLLELHSAGRRHPELAQLLDSWHAERGDDLEAMGMTTVGVQALYLTLLGCCQFEAVVPAGPRRRVEVAMVGGRRGRGRRRRHERSRVLARRPALQDDPSATFAALRTALPAPPHRAAGAALHGVARDRRASDAARRRDVVVAVRSRTGVRRPGPRRTTVLVSSDPPRHTDERLAISRLFKPSVIDAMGPDIRTIDRHHPRRAGTAEAAAT